MELNYHGSKLDFDEEYIPSGSWYPQSFDDTHLEPFFPENITPTHYSKDSNNNHPNTYHDLDSNRDLLHMQHAPEQNFDSRSSSNYTLLKHLEIFPELNFDSRSSSANSQLKQLENTDEINFDNRSFSNNSMLKHLENNPELNYESRNSPELNYNRRIAPELNYDSASSSSSVREDPFSVRCRIPMPDMEHVSGYQLWLEASFMGRRNERERQRVRSVNDGFSRLRNHLPRGVQIRRRQSKVETLRHAITYIRQLQMMVDDKEEITCHSQLKRTVYSCLTDMMEF